MSRQFFVGGNFKMNPNCLAEKKALVTLLNQAELNPSVGELSIGTGARLV